MTKQGYMIEPWFDGERKFSALGIYLIYCPTNRGGTHPKVIVLVTVTFQGAAAAVAVVVRADRNSGP